MSVLHHWQLAYLFTGALVLYSPSRWHEPSVEPTATITAPEKYSRVARHRVDGRYTIYLSFDDGPCAGSSFVNELAKKDSLPIDVFLVGKNVSVSRKNLDLLREYEANAFVEIGNHSFTHAEQGYRQYFNDPAKVVTDIDRNRDSLRLSNGLVRLPGRNFFRVDSLSRNDRENGKEAADRLAGDGYQLFGWDLEWRIRKGNGFETHDAEEMLKIVEYMLSNGKTFLPGQIVLLLHDREMADERFRVQLEEFVRLVRNEGRFDFGHLGEYAP